MEEHTDPHGRRRRRRVRLPRPWASDRRAGDLPAPLHRGPRRLGPEGDRRHRRPPPCHRLRQPRRRCDGRQGAALRRGDGPRRHRVHPCPAPRQGRSPRVLPRWWRRPDGRPPSPRARPADDPRRHRPQGRRRHRRDPQDRRRRQHQGSPHPEGLAQLPVLPPHTERQAGRQGLLRPTQGADRTVPGPCARRLPNARLTIYPDSGHGGVFQHHEEFVPAALAFLTGAGETSR